MADDFSWAERRRFLPSFCVSSQERSLSAAVPALLSRFPPHQLSCFFFFTLLRTICPGANWGYGDDRLPAVLEKKRNSICGREDASQDVGSCGPQSVGRSLPVDWVPPISLGTCRAAELYPRTTGAAALSPFCRATHLSAGFRLRALILRRLVCADWLL